MQKAAAGKHAKSVNKPALSRLTLRPVHYALLIGILTLVLSFLYMRVFVTAVKGPVVFACVLSVLLLLLPLRRKHVTGRISWPVPAFAAYLIFLGLSVIWASSGKFFLKEYSKLLLALPVYLYILLFVRKEETAVRRVILTVSCSGALFALLSVDMAGLKLTEGILHALIPDMKLVDTAFEAHTRLTGIFGNANILAGVLGICIFLSLYLTESAQSKGQRAFCSVLLSLQAFTFLLNFSLGASGFFLLCVIVYLIFAGERRLSLLLRMLQTAIPTVILVFLAFPSFAASGAKLAVPLLADAACAGICVAAELLLYPRLLPLLEKRKKLTTVLPCAIILLAAVYGICALSVTGPAELSEGNSLRRSVYPAPGSYRLEADCSSNPIVTVVSQNETDVVVHSETQLYRGRLSKAEFTVPEDSIVVYITLRSTEGCVVHSAELVPAQGDALPVKLNHPLLPGFIANRLQGLRANQNAIQRVAFFRDGMKLFRSHPVLGCGLGSFESLVSSYQDFDYETRYVHNHYIQVLLDSGLIGLLLYLAILLLSLWCLLRRFREDGPFRALRPALLAAFLMLCLHSSMEVVMSTTIYLPYAFVLLALIALLWGDRVSTDRKAAGTALHWSLCALNAVYALLIVLNLSAANNVNRNTDSEVRYFSALDRAIATDVFDRTDWKLSYIVSCTDQPRSSYMENAKNYADDLLKTRSNSLHRHLLDFYLSIGDYDKALQAARTCADCNRAKVHEWEYCFSLLERYVAFEIGDSAELYRCARELYRHFLDVNDSLLLPMTLDEETAAFLKEAGALQ